MKDREAWRAAVLGVAKSQTQLSDWTTARQSGASLILQTPSRGGDGTNTRRLEGSRPTISGKMCSFGKLFGTCVINSFNQPLLCAYYVPGPDWVLILQTGRISRQINRQVWSRVGSAVPGER